MRARIRVARKVAGEYAESGVLFMQAQINRAVSVRFIIPLSKHVIGARAFRKLFVHM